jgi:hypothetical protein
MANKGSWRADFSIRRLFTLWCTKNWSAALGIVMLFVAAGDVVFTLLNVERFGLAGEINPFPRLMIGTGGPFTILWVAIDLMSTILLYTPLISLFLMLPIQTREGKASTVISSILTARITVSLFNVAIYYYSFLETVSALLIVGVVLMFLLRFIMRNGDYLSWSTIKSILHGLGVSLSSPVVGFFSAVSHPFRFRRQKAAEDSRLSATMRETDTSATASRPPPFVVKRDRRRIAILVGLTILVPVAMFAAMDVLVVVSGLENVPPSQRSIYTLGSSLEGWVFIIGFVMILVGVMLFAYLLMKLADALKGKTKFVQTM